MRTKRNRPAIAMIELIFALVIMGIALLSAPTILNMSIQSSNTALQQESIAAAASKISLILTYPWDEGDTTDNTGHGILRTTNGDVELSRAQRPVVASKVPYASRDWNNPALGQTEFATPENNFGNGRDLMANNDIDDFDGTRAQLMLYRNDERSLLTQNEGEYTKGTNFDMNTLVNYANDATNFNNAAIIFNNPFTRLNIPGGSSNIKLVTVTLVPARNAAGQEEIQDNVTLRAFACNIGNGALSMINGTEIVAVP